MRYIFSQLLPRFFYLPFFAMLVFGCCVHAKNIPTFVDGSIYSSNKAIVSVIEPTFAADLVIMNGGLEQGLRLGMVCRVHRGTQLIGEIVIIESRSDRSAGLILNLSDGYALRAGDIACVKTFQNS